MAQLRNASTELGKFTEWIKRKMVNHQPLKELKDKAINDDGSFRVQGMYEQKVGTTIFRAGEDTVLYKEGDRTFKITVEEITEQPDLDMVMQQFMLDAEGDGAKKVKKLVEQS